MCCVLVMLKELVGDAAIFLCSCACSCKVHLASSFSAEVSS